MTHPKRFQPLPGSVRVLPALFFLLFCLLPLAEAAETDTQDDLAMSTPIAEEGNNRHESLQPVETAPSPSSVTGRKTLTRKADYVVVRGKRMKKNLHTRIDRLSLFVKQEGKVQPIPFQIDEINAEGEWILPHVPPYLRDASVVVERDDDNGCLDENDELVFMIRDSGDRLLRADFPEGALAVDEIMLTDPVDNGRAWVYLCSFCSNPPLSDRDYVSYVFPQNRVITDDYELGFSLEVPVSWDSISFRGEPNMIDRMKIRFSMKIFGIRYRRDETHFKSDLSSYKDGPVRVIRRVRSSFRLNRLLKTPSTASESIYYDNAVVAPFRVKVPVSMKALPGIVSGLEVRGGVDMQNMHGWSFRADVEDRWMSIDGAMDEKEKSIQGEGSTWFLLAGTPGAFLCRMILDRNWDGSFQELPMTTDLFYVDDDHTPDPPEFVPGQSPNVGFFMRGAENLSRGTYYFFIINYMIKDYQNGREVEFLNILDQPVRVSVDKEQRTCPVDTRPEEPIP